MTPRQKALFIAGLAESKKAEDIVILDMRKLSGITDFFVIATASSTKRAQTIADYIDERLHDVNEPVYNIEGYQEARWVLIDAYDVVAHIFNKDAREFYNLEGLWTTARKIRLCHPRKKRAKNPQRKSQKKSCRVKGKMT